MSDAGTAHQQSSWLRFIRSQSFGLSIITKPRSTPPKTVQPRQVCVVTSHTGVAPEHSAFEVHPTHTPAATLQNGIMSTQAAAFVAEH